MKKYRIVIVENDEDEQYFIREGFVAANPFDVPTMVKKMEAHFSNEWNNILLTCRN